MGFPPPEQVMPMPLENVALTVGFGGLWSSGPLVSLRVSLLLQTQVFFVLKQVPSAVQCSVENVWGNKGARTDPLLHKLKTPTGKCITLESFSKSRLLTDLKLDLRLESER